ncbi:MAG: hypothetical protein AAB134_04195 [Pseudomonadota bacterium]
MKYAKILLALWLTGSAEIVSAGSFADSFRDFIVGKEAQASPARGNGLDKVAAGCVSCHNGSAAAHVNVRAAGTVAPMRGFQTGDHPVGMLYEESVRKDPQGYRPAAALHPNIRLVDGSVTCVTCHKARNELLAANETQSPAQPAKPRCAATKEMTTGPRDKTLCLACHIK